MRFFFAVDEVFTAGQPIGMVLADSAKHAEAGARAVMVQYEELPAIFSRLRKQLFNKVISTTIGT